MLALQPAGAEASVAEGVDDLSKGLCRVGHESRWGEGWDEG